MNKEKKNIPEITSNNSIFSIPEERTQVELILNRAGSLYCVNENITAGELTEHFIKETSLRIICVVNTSMKALGIINRDTLLNIMGSKFGRELYYNRKVLTLMVQAPVIYYKRNTFSVVEELKEQLQNYEDKYYILVDSDNCFKGILSSRDLTIFLSDMMTNDILAARKIHKAIVKEETTVNNDLFEFTGASLMAGGIGGDFHAIRQIGDNLWAIIFFDVSGKGVKAALISVAISSMFSIYTFDNDFSDLILKINSYIYDLFNGENFITGIFMMFNETTGETRIYDMGHSMIYIMKEEKIFQLKSSENNLPIGITPELNPELKIYTLKKNELLISVSDGITEQNNYRNEPYGEKRLISLISRNRSLESLFIKNAIIKDISRYRHGQAQGDDMSVMILKYKSWN